MSDDGPENLTLRHLRGLSEQIEQLSKNMALGFETVSGHLIGLTGRVAGLEVRVAAIEAWSADTTRRLERIERRLDLVEAPAA
jgi:hypothetical protein